jgi:hypothetical protein
MLGGERVGEKTVRKGQVCGSCEWRTGVIGVWEVWEGGLAVYLEGGIGGKQ